eukprot:TRINITY_DN9624_c0_g1_i1.p3 TRINITY_DN9624_c0_g1~~TRINITY_DN9624_c0_g1_i1.p3  ORF type:complete len:81 (+),score=22.03 TRINITY_DN9624_c0_g1_i1:759-1001(+)
MDLNSEDEDMYMNVSNDASDALYEEYMGADDLSEDEEKASPSADQNEYLVGADDKEDAASAADQDEYLGAGEKSEPEGGD